MTDVKETAITVARRTEAKVDQILVMLGTETEDGKGGYLSTGLAGRVRRLEDKSRITRQKLAIAAATGSGASAVLLALGSLLAFLVRGLGVHIPFGK